MKRVTCLVGATLLCICSSPSAASPESTQVAEVIVASQKETLANLRPVLLSQLDTSPRAGNVVPKARRMFAEECARPFSQGHLTQAMAGVLDAQFPGEEQKQLHAFFKSPVGAHYLAMAGDPNAWVRYVEPMFRQACAGAATRLELAGMRGLNCPEP